MKFTSHIEVAFHPLADTESLLNARNTATGHATSQGAHLLALAALHLSINFPSCTFIHQLCLKVSSRTAPMKHLIPIH